MLRMTGIPTTRDLPPGWLVEVEELAWMGDWRMAVDIILGSTRHGRVGIGRFDWVMTGGRVEGKSWEGVARRIYRRCYHTLHGPKIHYQTHHDTARYHQPHCYPLLRLFLSNNPVIR